MPETLQQTLHELRVHQIELELQNEELRRAHLELDTARARYFDLYDLAPIGYCTLNQGLIVKANLTAVSMLGMARASAIGRAFLRFVDVQDHRVLHALFQRLLASADRQTEELRITRSDGTQFWAQLVGILGHDEQGQPEQRLVITDITSRRQAEAGQRDSVTRYKELFSRAPDGIVLCSSSGTMEEANQSFRHMHGWDEGDLCAQNLSLLDTTGLAMAPSRVGKMLAGEVTMFEVQHRHRDGHFFPLEASTSLIFVGGVPRLLGYYRDLTQRVEVIAQEVRQ